MASKQHTENLIIVVQHRTVDTHIDACRLLLYLLSGQAHILDDTVCELNLSCQHTLGCVSQPIAGDGMTLWIVAMYFYVLPFPD